MLQTVKNSPEHDTYAPFACALESNKKEYAVSLILSMDDDQITELLKRFLSATSKF